MAVMTGLYPPILDDSIPAFVGSCRIYFSLSPYNSYQEIKKGHVQISLINQKTNTSAFKSDQYPSGIKITSIQYELDENQRLGDHKYYVQISKDDLINGEFGLNQFYKVQLRFGSTAAPTEKGIATWLYENRNTFSEWSKVCLIKAISQPEVTIRGFEDTDNNSDQEIILADPNLKIVGYLKFNNSQETEYLKSYNIKLYQTENMDNLLIQSEQIYTSSNHFNEFNYQLPYDLEDGVNYTVVLTYTTNNSYTASLEYKFIVIQHGIERLDVDITATPDEENGWIKVNVTSDEVFIGNFTIRRTSSESDFHKWEDIKTVAYSSETNLNYTFYDITIQSGIWYKYCIQKRNIYGDRGVITQIRNPVMCLLDNIFLTRGDCQLKIQFNPTLTDFKYNVTESQQVTLGAKYPFIKRNGNNYFRTFSIGGLISSFSDTTDWYDPHFYDGRFHDDENEIKNFTSKEDIYGQSLDLYNNYNNRNNISDYNDYIYEAKFREKVYDFLYKHNVKLFRSATEGNILIKLMNISFQPVETLGRRLFSFTATAVQVDEANIQNYEKYGINIIGNYNSEITLNYESFNNISGTFSNGENYNIITEVIGGKNGEYQNRTNKTYNDNVRALTYLKLEIDSDPYVIIEKDGKLKKATTNDGDINNATIGYIAIINGVYMVITPKMERIKEGNQIKIIHNGFFELKGDDVSITSLAFPEPTSVDISYVALVERSEDTSKVVRRNYYYHKPGQLYQTFKPKDTIMQKIFNKYILNYKKYYQRLVDIMEIQLEGPVGAVVYIKDSEDTNYNRHVLENGYLQLKDDEVTINNLYFCGRHLWECKDPLAISTVNRVLLTQQQGIYDSLDQILNPVNGGIYQIKGYAVAQGSPFIENHRILVVDPNSTQYQEETNLSKVYTLLLNEITDDDLLKFVYYYDCWYVLSKGYEKAGLLKADIRHIRDYEYIPVFQTYSTFEEVQNPVPHGVYYITSGQATDDNPNKTFIYYHDKWYPFNTNNDVVCPIDGIVDYCCEVVKGEY